MITGTDAMKKQLFQGVPDGDPKKLTVIVKPTHACNLRCIYCYVPGSAERGLMSLATLRNAMTQATDIGRGKQITFIWHGGEPLLAGLQFFREIASISHLLREEGHDIKNVIQTNGTLITTNLLDFIVSERDFRLGFSLDGPAHINDHSRPTVRGRGSFRKIMAAIANIREFETLHGTDCIGGGAICVVGKHNIGQLEEIYSFFKSHNLSVKINPLFVSGRATDALSVHPIEYAEAMCRLFDIWMDDAEDSIRVDPFESIMSSLISGVPASCVFSLACTKTYVSIGPMGDIYPCGRFDGVREFHLGNVNSIGGLREALNSSTYRHLDTRPDSLDSGCLECQFLPICNGGCMHNAFINGHVMSKDPFCIAYKTLYGHILSRLKEVLKDAESQPLTSTEGVLV